MDTVDEYKIDGPNYWSELRLYQIILKRERGEKLTDDEQLVLAFEAGRDSCQHPH